MYNVWLAQLVERNEICGVTVAPQWMNVLFDILAQHTANIFGFAVAEKIVVSLCVLLFFWGSFCFLASVSGRPPWSLTPFLFVLAYGYVFHMGFMNYYLSLTLAFLGLAAGWQGRAGNWLAAAALGALSLTAHPIGFAFFVGAALYLGLTKKLRGPWRWGLLALAVLVLLNVRWFFAMRPQWDVEWANRRKFLDIAGIDQMKLFGDRYGWLAIVAFAWAVLAVFNFLYDWIIRGKTPQPVFRVTVELYLLSLFAISCLPENVRFSGSSAWAGLLGSRFTLISAVLGVLLLACVGARRWHLLGSCAIAAAFFALLYGDTGKLDRMEANARELVGKLPAGQRVVAVAQPPAGWRIPFVYHSVERACIGHCFSYGNYEPSSGQFRVRAVPGSSFVVSSNFKAEAIVRGDYVVQQSDLPLVSIYQCDAADWTRLCAAELRVGSKTGKPD
jgi:MFS family permease